MGQAGGYDDEVKKKEEQIAALSAFGLSKEATPSEKQGSFADELVKKRLAVLAKFKKGTRPKGRKK